MADQLTVISERLNEVEQRQPRPVTPPEYGLEAPTPQPHLYNPLHNLNFTPQGASALPPPQVHYQVYSQPLRVNHSVPVSTAQVTRGIK